MDEQCKESEIEPNSKSKEEEIINLINELKDKLQKNEIICLVYNPLLEDGIKEADCYFMHDTLKQTHYTYPLLILSGIGGDFNPGILLPRLILKQVKKYNVYVPSVCGSSLCYTILKANELLISKNSKITQIDPSFPHEGETLRAILHLKNANPSIKSKAREVFDLAEQQIRTLSKSPSVFKFKTMDSGEFLHWELIVDYFLNKETHESQLTLKELKELEVNYSLVDEETNSLACQLVQACQDFAIQQNLRAIVINTSTISKTPKDESEFRVFFMPKN